MGKIITPLQISVVGRLRVYQLPEFSIALAAN